MRVVILAGLRSLTLNRGRSDVPFALRLADGAGAAAIILYGVIFGLGGALQIIAYPHDVGLQGLEFLGVVLLAFPIVGTRYSNLWRKFMLSTSIEDTMRNVTGVLAGCGAFGGFFVILFSLADFTIPLMPLLVCYILAWPAAVLYYLSLEERPTAASTAFPLPRVFHALWHAYVGGRSRKDRNSKKP